jgi:hypothetical protein
LPPSLWEGKFEWLPVNFLLNFHLGLPSPGLFSSISMK